jgi:hypothetical protein
MVAPGTYPRRKHQSGPPIGFAPALPSNYKTVMENLMVIRVEVIAPENPLLSKHLQK